ncbi:hypothetical protein AVEN_157510-1 [Araneus ventricosus]|uniref:Uncharacterized protein n=1 Tax=Araneus ventricosus TaxID=182803 RepID=A0A4Y2VIQ4_ARAVE|nr:hypothetical protein AVEN_157510-1 [Araneus ventricosus]
MTVAEAGLLMATTGHSPTLPVGSTHYHQLKARPGHYCTQQGSDTPLTYLEAFHPRIRGVLPVGLADIIILPKPLSYLKAEIKSAALSIWQDNWDNGETGRSTHDIVPRVSNKSVGWNREEIMFITGHPSYLQSSNT